MPSPTIRWFAIALPKDLGGLGVGDIMYRNLILLFKWWWRFFEAEISLWKWILLSIHNIRGLKASTDAFSNVKEGILSQMVCTDDDTSKIRTIVEKGMILSVGCG